MHPAKPQIGSHKLLEKWHTSSGAMHGSSSSHWSAWIGRQAATQSAQAGQLDVAQPLQMKPGPQGSQNAPHAGAHSPVAKMQRLSSAQSA